MSSLFKNLLLVLGLALVVWFGYTLFVRDSGDDARNDTRVTQVQRDTQDFLQKLQQLRELNFGNALFSDPRFQSLIDLRQDIEPEPVGRNNPFLPTN